MSENWKHDPHWVLRFNKYGKWELSTTGGVANPLDNLGVRNLTVSLRMGVLPSFEIDGLFYDSAMKDML